MTKILERVFEHVREYRDQSEREEGCDSAFSETMTQRPQTFIPLEGFYSL